MKTLFLIFAICLTLSLADQDALAKSQELRALVLEQSDYVLTLNSTGYHYYLETLPRPYDVVVFFTADNCNFCDEIYAEYVGAAQTYVQNNGIYPSKDKKQRAVYFTRIVYSVETKEIFSKFNFQSVPNLYISTPKMARLKETEKIQYIKDHLWQITGTNGHVTSSKLLEKINKNVGRNIEYKESIVNLLIGFGILGVIATIFIKLFLRFRSFFVNSQLWFVGSVTIYFVCMSGLIYNIIHGVPFTNIDRAGNFEWYHSGQRSQFGLEGFIMSGGIVLGGLLMVGFQKLPSLSGGSSSTIAYAVLIFAIFLSIRFVEDIYTKKSGFYGPNFWPPAHYIKGPLMKDQGNNI